MKSVNQIIAGLPQDIREKIGARADELMAEEKQRHVYIVQYIGTGIIHGCFSTQEKAEQFVGASTRFWVLKCEVL